MLFEVLYHGVVKFFTNDKNCIPPKKQLLRMQELGYEFKLNNKPYYP